MVWKCLPLNSSSLVCRVDHRLDWRSSSRLWRESRRQRRKSRGGRRRQGWRGCSRLRVWSKEGSGQWSGLLASSHCFWSGQLLDVPSKEWARILKPLWTLSSHLSERKRYATSTPGRCYFCISDSWSLSVAASSNTSQARLWTRCSKVPTWWIVWNRQKVLRGNSKILRFG